MSGDAFQRFIDQHPGLFVSIFPIYFLALWCLVATVISFVGGWHTLAGLYRARVPFSGTKRRMQSGQMRWLTNYNSVLTLGANPEGLYLASMFLFRFMHPPLFIPWNQIRVRRSKGWIFEYVIFTLGSEAGIPLRLRAGVADDLRRDAGGAWPVEEV